MSELTYKKIIDVETVEALNDGATVFVNDNGAMKQVGADKFGAVKTVNGVEPDENGDIAVEIPEPVQPDWNQNDPNAADYVKNRTHYEAIVTDTLMPEGRLTKLEERTFEIETFLSNYYGLSEDRRVLIEDGEKSVRFVFNGEQYDLTFNDDWYCFGNCAIKYSGAENTGEPFVVDVDEDYVLMTEQDIDNVTLSVTFTCESATWIDKKYLPSDIVYKDEKDGCIPPYDIMGKTFRVFGHNKDADGNLFLPASHGYDKMRELLIHHHLAIEFAPLKNTFTALLPYVGQGGNALYFAGYAASYGGLCDWYMVKVHSDNTITYEKAFSSTVDTLNLILRSPNGSRWKVNVSNDGTLSTEAVTD